MGDDLSKEERGKRGVKDARALLREILSVGMPEQYADIKRDASAGLMGLDRAEAAIEEFRRGEWIAGGAVDEEARGDIDEMPRPAEEDCESECCEDTLVLGREGARMVLARMHVVDELPQCDAPRRSVAEIADALDSSGRDADYVEEVLGTLEGHGVADVGDNGARLAHRSVVVEPLVEGDSDGDTEAALAELRAAASAELREASMEDVLAAAETGLRDSPSLHPDDVVEIEGENWQIAPALRALYDRDLQVEDVLDAITDTDASRRHLSDSSGVDCVAMPDDENGENDEEEMSFAERHDEILAAQHNIETKRVALDVLQHSVDLRGMESESVVCDDQREILVDGAERVEDAADAIWPGEGGVPDLEVVGEDDEECGVAADSEPVEMGDTDAVDVTETGGEDDEEE